MQCRDGIYLMFVINMMAIVIMSTLIRYISSAHNSLPLYFYLVPNTYTLTITFRKFHPRITEFEF